MTKDRFRFRIPITNLDGVFDRFIFCDVYHEPIHFIGSAIFLTPEQCTGLKDKNGRLIYEGDIVAYSGIDLWRVVFEEKYCSFELLGKDGMSVSVSVHKEMTVVGNVHENPALLEANNEK